MNYLRSFISVLLGFLLYYGFCSCGVFIEDIGDPQCAQIIILIFLFLAKYVIMHK